MPHGRADARRDELALIFRDGRDDLADHPRLRRVALHVAGHGHDPPALLLHGAVDLLGEVDVAGEAVALVDQEDVALFERVNGRPEDFAVFVLSASVRIVENLGDGPAVRLGVFAALA